jgi:hypothetical protein
MTPTQVTHSSLLWKDCGWCKKAGEGLPLYDNGAACLLRNGLLVLVLVLVLLQKGMGSL